MAWLGNYSKSVAALAIGALTWGITVIRSPAHGITPEEWAILLSGIVATITVWAVPNAKPGTGLANDPVGGVNVVVTDPPTVPQV